MKKMVIGWKFKCTNGRRHRAKSPNNFFNILMIQKKSSSQTICPIKAFQQYGWTVTTRFDTKYGAYVVSE